MKKSILNLGKALNKAEQKEIKGSRTSICHTIGRECKYDYNCGPHHLSCYMKCVQSTCVLLGMI